MRKGSKSFSPDTTDKRPVNTGNLLNITVLLETQIKTQEVPEKYQSKAWGGIEKYYTQKHREV